MNFTDIIIFLLKRKKYSIGLPILAGILGFVIASVVKPYYKSEIKVILDTGAKTANISSLLKGAVPSNLIGALGNIGGSENEDLYLEILDGRDVHLATIEKFKLDTIYKGTKYKEALLKKFYNDMICEASSLTGIVSCFYEAKNKVLARDIVRFFVGEANRIYIKLRKEKSLQTIEELNSFKKTLLASADSLSNVLVEFYRNNNLLDLESQLKLTITALASYEEQIKTLKINESKAGSDNLTAVELRKKRRILESEFKKLRGEFSEEYLPSKNSIYINSDWAVEKYIEQQRLENDLRRYFTALEMLESNIVMEEGNAAKNMPIIQVVQDAYLPDYKSGPKRAIWAIVACFIATVLIYFVLFLKGILNNEIICKQETKDSLERIIKAIKM